MLPITSKLTEYTADNISLHVPGHHNGTIGQPAVNLAMDMTEITGLDDYHHAEGIISQSEQLLARDLQYIARYLVNGTTSGILSVIHSAEHIAVMRNAHKSVFNALSLTNKQAFILPTVVSEQTFQYSAVDINHISEEVLKESELAVLTYPNYFGETYPLEELIEFFHAHQIEVLIDEAHGAHFDITDNFPHSAVQFGADYVVQSYHKTLPALTMGSVIHIKKSARLKEAVLHNLSIFQTSSPSYLVLSSLEQAHVFYQHYQDDVFFERRRQLLQTLMQHFKVIESDDPLKVMITRQGYTGMELQHYLERNGIFTELATSNLVLLVLPLWHEHDRFPFERLIQLINAISLPDRIDEIPVAALPVHGGKYQQPRGQVASIAFSNAQGRTAAESLIPYPPGIPYVLAGEQITNEHIDFLRRQPNVHGMINGQIKIIEEG